MLIGDFIQYTDLYVNNWWLLLYFVIGITKTILGIIVFVKSIGYYCDFVRLVKGVLLFETIVFPYTQGVLQYIKSGFQIIAALITAFIALILAYFVWYRLNIKYFKKRISVATNNISDEKTNNFEQTLTDDEDIKNDGFVINEAIVFKDELSEIKGTIISEEKQLLNEESDNESSKIHFCRRCGAKLLEDSVFCDKCGKYLMTVSFANFVADKYN